MNPEELDEIRAKLESLPEEIASSVGSRGTDWPSPQATQSTLPEVGGPSASQFEPVIGRLERIAQMLEGRQDEGAGAGQTKMYQQMSLGGLIGQMPMQQAMGFADQSLGIPSGGHGEGGHGGKPWYERDWPDPPSAPPPPQPQPAPIGGPPPVASGPAVMPPGGQGVPSPVIASQPQPAPSVPGVNLPPETPPQPVSPPGPPQSIAGTTPVASHPEAAEPSPRPVVEMPTVADVPSPFPPAELAARLEPLTASFPEPLSVEPNLPGLGGRSGRDTQILGEPHPSSILSRTARTESANAPDVPGSTFGAANSNSGIDLTSPGASTGSLAAGIEKLNQTMEVVAQKLDALAAGSKSDEPGSRRDQSSVPATRGGMGDLSLAGMLDPHAVPVTKRATRTNEPWDEAIDRTRRAGG